jgi:competence protein ComEC
LHARSAARLTVLPLNGGSAVFCDAGKTSLLIDCGNENSVGFITKPFLRAQGVNRLSCLALTHGDDRHIGGGESLSALLPVTQIAASSARFRSPAYRRILDSLRETPGRGLVLRCGDHLGNWTVLHPASDNSLVQADDNALVLRGDFGGTRILLLSDLGRAGQAALLERAADLRADVVVACLPEQSEPAGDALLDAICPKLLIVADSELPATKRAGEALRERLARRGIPVIYTRTAGAVTIAIRKEQWIARAMNGQTHQGRQADAEVRQGSGRTSYTSP